MEYRYHGKIAEIEGLRGIAILLVTIHHFWPSSGDIYQTLSPIAHLGWIGVDLFFVISGFLIGGILIDTKNKEHYFRNFYVRRVLRIFPLYYAFVIGLFIIIPVAQSFIHNVSYWDAEFIKESGNPLWYLFFLGNVRESITGVEPSYFLAPLWSISIEEQFYLLAPLLIHKLTIKQLKITLGLLICISPIFRFLMLDSFPDNERIQYLATISRFDNLSAGLVLAIIVRSNYFINKQLVSYFLVTLTICLGVIFYAGGLDRYTFFCRVFGYSILALYFFTLVLWCIQNRDTTASFLLRSRFLTYLGGLCYGLYLLQRPSEILLLKSLSYIGWDLAQHPSLSLILKTVFAILVSQIVWSYFEKPINNLKNKFETANHPANSPQGRVAIDDSLNGITPSQRQIG
ncbi:acyltransferase [Rheinheimera baltica]|uniref:acyltransferase family protein n=1 Tax=Rheinheimera baltica TaxID=67576 RepID=UPI00273FEE56|nr:acyltransferase [Rheinheimera baltica]MDP5142015.1 acyltransferase [Rheinheimera baltica]